MFQQLKADTGVQADISSVNVLVIKSEIQADLYLLLKIMKLCKLVWNELNLKPWGMCSRPLLVHFLLEYFCSSVYWATTTELQLPTTVISEYSVYNTTVQQPKSMLKLDFEMVYGICFLQ